MKIITLYQELLRKTMEENRYLKDNIDVEPDTINKLETEKRVSRDKIEKYLQKTPTNLEEEHKETLKKIINYIIAFEAENIEMYKKKMTKNTDDLKVSYKDLELKKTYITTSHESRMYDKKK